MGPTSVGAVPLRRGIDWLDGWKRRSEIASIGPLLGADGAMYVPMPEIMSYPRPPELTSCSRCARPALCGLSGFSWLDRKPPPIAVVAGRTSKWLAEGV